MESKIREPAPSAWLAAALGSWRIRSDACDFEFIQKALSAGFKPARMSRFEGNAPIESISQHGKECASNARIECEARRQLHEQAAGARTQRRDGSEKVSNWPGAICKALIMRDGARNLDGEAERAWHALRPPLESRRAMRAIESGIDLHCGKHLRIAIQMRFAGWEAGLFRARNAPSGGSDVSLRRHAGILGAHLPDTVGAGWQALSGEYR